MKKRIVCVLLTLIMLLSLVPMGASAASHRVSEAAITVLKQMTTFRRTCYPFTGSEVRIGYGTVCEKEHGFDLVGKFYQKPPKLDENGKVIETYYDHEITEKQADLDLRKALLALDEKVCAFETANGLSLKQHQHDALVVFSYNAGTDWMNGNGVLKSVIINKGDANEMLNAMNQWTNNADLSRREVEVNMYMNGIYSNTPPSNYGCVIYDPNHGTIPQQDYDRFNAQYTYHYDLYKEMEHPVVPTRAGYKFLGWYQDVSGNLEWTPVLTLDCDGQTLTAQWQQNGKNEDSALSVFYQMHEDDLASRKVYVSVSSEKHDEDLTDDFKDYLDDNDELFYVDRDYIDSDGIRWSHVYDNSSEYSFSGWVKVGEAYENESTTDDYGTVIATATVTTNGYLNLRKEAGTDNPIVGALAKNDTVNIYEIKTVNGHQWGRSKSGWLCLTYTRLILKDDVTISDEGAKIYGFTGVVKNGDLEVHVEPGYNTNVVRYTVPHPSNPKGDDQKADLKIPVGTSVTLTNLFYLSSRDETWAKATWQNPEWEWKSDKASDGKDTFKVTRSGWVQLVGDSEDPYVEMDSVKYTVVADSVSVRSIEKDIWGNDIWGDSTKLIMSLNKGVQVKVDEIRLIGENIWGRIQVKRDEHVNDYIDGCVNLASKYFSRDDAPTLEEEKTTGNLVATVINTDALKVRKTSATYGQQIGTLSRGTTVAVWEYDDGWYKVDSNKNGEYDYKEDGWCSEAYLDVYEETVRDTVTDNAGNSYETDGTGKGIVANTYSGVNVRTGPGTAYAANGKLLPGTVVEILETKNGGKWGRVAQGWISMDYVTMITYNEVIPETAPNGGSYVESFDKADKTTTTAIYTGVLSGGVPVYRNPEVNPDEQIRMSFDNENVTIYELAAVTKTVNSDTMDTEDPALEDEDQTTITTVTTTTYWARINDGWIQNPAKYLSLNPLDEKVHTQTSVEKLNVRRAPDETADNVFDVLIRGDQVKVTALTIVKDKVWGRIETNEGTGWIRLDYMSEGAIYVKAPVQNNTPSAPTGPVLGNTSSTGGFVNNSTGYRYTGKVIRANEVNVRANPSTTAAKTTSLKNGAALVIYETTVAENMAWGRCDAGWIYLYYVDLTPVVNGAVDARVVYNENTIIYSDVNCTTVAGTYSRMSTIDIYEIVGKMARTELGWVNVDNLL